MKILLCGGTNTKNIETEMLKKFVSGTVQFIVTKYIEDIEGVITRGEYFDRAIIIEQGWNKDFTETDESVIRERINSFAVQCKNLGLEYVEFIFLTQTEESAVIVSEETLQIKANSIIVVKKPRYSVPFFIEMITQDIKSVHPNYVYNPDKQLESDKEDEVASESEETGIEDDEGSSESEEDIDDIDTDDIEDELGDLGGIEGLEEIDNEDIFDELENLEENEENEDEEEDSLEIDEADVELNQELKDDDLYDKEDFGEADNEVEGNIEEYFSDIEKELGLEDEEDEEDEEVFVESTQKSEYQDGFGECNEEDFINTAIVPEELGDKAGRTRRSSKDADAKKRFSGRGKSAGKYGKHKNKNGREEYIKELKDKLDILANKGTSITVTGAGGAGVSTMVSNIANILNKLGYKVMVVDLDTVNRAQAYISGDNYRCVGHDDDNLKNAVNSVYSRGIETYTSIVRQGMHLITTGLAEDTRELNDVIQKDKIVKFVNMLKANYDFVVYDIPFKHAIDFASDILMLSDSIAYVIDSSNWGITKAMIELSNIGDENVEDVVYNKANIIFNRGKAIVEVMGKYVNGFQGIPAAIDKSIKELLGEDPGYHVRGMNICGVINYDEDFEKEWYGKERYSDSELGEMVFIQLINGLITGR